MPRTNTCSASLLAISTVLLFSAGAYGDTPLPLSNTSPQSELPNFQLVRFLPRLKFKVGEVRVYKITLKQSWQATLAGSQPLGMGLTESATATETVKSVRTSDGAGTVQIRFRSVALSANGQPYTADSVVGPFRNQTVSITIRPDGKVISERATGPDPSPYFGLLLFYNRELLSSTADFPKHPVEIGATWTNKYTDSKSQGQTDDSGTLLDIKDFDGKKVGFFHTTFATSGTGRSKTSGGLVNDAYGGTVDGYSDQSFNLSGGYLRGSTGMVHQNGSYNFGLTQRAYDNGLVLKANSGVIDSTCYYTVDLVNVIR